MTYIYKITPYDAWRQAEKIGYFIGSGIDLSDGYIHFSTAQQVKETAAKHFSRQTDLLLICVEASRLGAALNGRSPGEEKISPSLHATYAARRRIRNAFRARPRSSS